MQRSIPPRRSRPLVALAVLGAVVAAVLAAPSAAFGERVSAGGAAATKCAWSNTGLSPDRRADLLLQASTLDQELRWLDEQAANNPAQTTFGSVTYPAQVACTPTVVYSDGPDYVRGRTGTTIFPAQLALASSFDEDLAFAKGKAQADEAFRSGLNGLLAPSILSSRTPVNGRLTDALGEDSVLSGRLAAADVKGIQTGNPDEPVMAILKHYVGNEQELDRQTSSSNIDGRTLREVYDLAFQIAVTTGDPAGVMCSYNQINGVYACENPILNNLLKADNGYKGYVVSDFGAVHSTAPSLSAGLDQELNAPKYYTPANIGAALDNGSVTRAQIDSAAHRVVRSYIAAGLFDRPLPATPTTSASNAQNRAVAQQIAERGSVLLKNDDAVLPLTKQVKSIALIGPTASKTPTNGVSAATVCAMKNFGPATTCPNVVAPLDALTTRAAKAGATVTFNDGSDPASAAAAAAAADVAIVFGYNVQGEGADRTALNLDGNGDALIAAVGAANPKTVAILETGSPTTMPWLGQVKGVVQAWYPGEQQGTALSRLLYGDVDFTGHLPVTFPKSLADIPTQTPAQYPGLVNGSVTRPSTDRTSIRQVSYSEGLAVGYKWYESKNIEPLFPFGFGLSYTGFSYSKLQLSPAVVNNGNRKVQVTFTVTNTGKTAGTTTPQVYLTLPSSTGEPGRRLVGFDTVQLQPGASQRVTVTIDPKDVSRPFSFYDTAAHAWRIASGSYGVGVGDSSNPTLTGTITYAG